MQDVTAEMRAGYARRRELVLRLSHELECEKVKVIPPQGAFYFFLDLRALKMSSVEMCEKILMKSVWDSSLVPLLVKKEGFIRMTIAASDEDVEAGFGRSWSGRNDNSQKYSEP
ncbi:MAG: aminotransferase class I/II-fold pyridoxal phosphate-dependent enzyme [Anaerolineales bacterium]|nr:aminotransferase class I/II-fold pyridoxal phosphate-dependent enzyme [Anaerolineales bacterium]